MFQGQLTAVQLAEGIRAHRWTAEQVVEESLNRATVREPALSAWSHLASTALQEAQQRDREASRGPLHGVPVAVKDLFDTHDMPTSYGSPFYADHQPKVDSAAVALARAAGAVILGKTATVEFGATKPCATRNPRNTAHTPGGSSSGSAAVVADGQVPLALGTQTGGSIIRPASFCGVVGFKPTFGAISPAGVKSFAWSLDTVGCFARSVEDVCLFFDVLRGTRSTQDVAEPKAPRIGVFHGPFAARADAAARDCIGFAEAACTRAGAVLTAVGALPGFEATLDQQRTISRFELGRSLQPERRAPGSETLGSDLLAEIDRGLAVKERHYMEALRQARAASAMAYQVFDGCDVILTYATPGEAPEGLSSTGDPTFNLSWSLLGWPCICLPVSFGPNGLPLSIQLVGPPGRDHHLLEAAGWIERQLNFSPPFMEL
jgi:Asp-tRNA(Asn)/Glu-tRNA(Gln) amidotransferase A subunit family amidase